MAIHWKRSVEGFVESHDGRWRITPNYFSCVAAQSYRLHHDGKTVSHACQTQRDAKAEADRLVAPCYGKGCGRPAGRPDGAPAPGAVGLDYRASCCTCGRRVKVTIGGRYAHHAIKRSKT